MLFTVVKHNFSSIIFKFNAQPNIDNTIFDDKIIFFFSLFSLPLRTEKKFQRHCFYRQQFVDRNISNEKFSAECRAFHFSAKLRIVLGASCNNNNNKKWVWNESCVHRNIRMAYIGILLTPIWSTMTAFATINTNFTRNQAKKKLWEKRK